MATPQPPRNPPPAPRASPRPAASPARPPSPGAAAPLKTPPASPPDSAAADAITRGARSFSLSPGRGNPWPLFGQTMRQILGARKTFALSALLLIPVLLTVIVHGSSSRGLENYGDFYREQRQFDSLSDITNIRPEVPDDASGGLLWFQDISIQLLFPLLIPLMVAIFASSTISEEVEGKTLPYLFTRPIYRNWLVLPKTLAIMASLSLISMLALIVFWFASVSLTESPFAHFGQLLGFLSVAGLTVFATGGLFTLIGTLMRRAAIVAGIYLFVWETGLSNIPLGLIKKLSLVHYERAILYEISGRNVDVFEVFVDTPSAGAGITVLLVIGLLGLLLALYVVSNKDYNV